MGGTRYQGCLAIIAHPFCTRLLGFASLASEASVSLAWYAVTGPQLAGYKLYYGLASGNYGLNNHVGKCTTAAISRLEEGKTYYFAVLAYDAAGY
jgi:hypothetical protein